jgi:hypothetical protein
MTILLRLFGGAVAFAALAVTGALAQSPESISIQLVSTFDSPGATQTLPRRLAIRTT